MDKQQVVSFIKKYWFNTMLISFVLLMLFSPTAKSWVIQRLFSVGLFSPDIKKEDPTDLRPYYEFSFLNAEGKVQSTKDFKGKVVLVNFWASWCAPCRAEMPSLEKLYQKMKDNNNLVFVFINEDDDKSKGINFLRTSQSTLPFSSAAGEIPKGVFSGTLPTTIVLNKEGRMVFRKEGAANYSSSAFVNQLKKLL